MQAPRWLGVLLLAVGQGVCLPACWAGEPPALRGTDAAGNPLPPGTLARLGTVRLRHADGCFAVVFLPDGKTLASGGGDGLRFWDAETGREVSRVRGQAGRVTNLALAAKRGLLASGGDELIRLWDLATGDESRRFSLTGERLGSLALAPDGKKLAASTLEGNLYLWDLEVGRKPLVLKPVRQRFTALAFTPDSQTLVSAECAEKPAAPDRLFRWWDAGSGRERQRRASRSGQVSGLVVAADGKTLFVLGDGFGPAREFADVKEWDGWSLGVAPDGKTVAVGDREQIWLWDPQRVRPPRSRPAPHGGHALAYSPDGSRLAAAGGSRGTVHIWDAKTGQPLAVPGDLQDSLNDLALAPDGKTVATAGRDGKVRLWDLGSGKERQVLEAQGSVFSVAFAPDGQKLVAVEAGPATPAGVNQVRVWDAAGRPLRAFPTAAGVSSVLFAPDGRTLLAGSKTAIRFWDPETGLERHMPWSHGATGLHRLALAPDGRTLLTGSSDGDVANPSPLLVWSMARGKVVGELGGAPGQIQALTFFADGQRVAAAGLEGAVVWNLSGGRVHRRMERHGRPAQAVAFSPDGQLLATGQAEDSLVRLWELASGQEVAQLEGHRGPVARIVFEPAGGLLTGSEDATVLRWNLPAAVRAGLAGRPRPRLWDDLRDERAATAFQAVCVLAGAGDEGVTLLQTRLRPEPARDEPAVRRWLAQLDDGEFTVREEASRRLREAGMVVEMDLRRLLEGQPSAEVKRRVEDLLDHLDQEALSPEQLRQRRAVQALGYVATPAARRLLRTLAGGEPQALQTREARAALTRLEANHRP